MLVLLLTALNFVFIVRSRTKATEFVCLFFVVKVGTDSIFKKEGFLLLQVQLLVSDISLRLKIIAEPTQRKS